MDLLNLKCLLLLCIITEVFCIYFPGFKEERSPSTSSRSEKIRALLRHIQKAKRSNVLSSGSVKAAKKSYSAASKLTKRTEGDNRVSFRECNLSNGERLNCGYFGITDEVCYQRGCCWGETTEPDVPWCYHSIPTITPLCTQHDDVKVECGWYGIRKEQCLAKNCCWQPSNDASVPWCYHEQRVPVFEGECGVPAIAPAVRSRIVGGVEANPHSWPWMVSLQSDNSHFCGGSLINGQWVVTAAHCEPGFWWGSSRSVVLGMHDQTSRGDAVSMEIDLIIPHEDYGSNNGYDSDVMLLKLSEPVEFRDEISPVCLVAADNDFSGGKRCYTTGWGTLRSGGDSPDQLQQVMVPLMDNEVCNAEQWYDGQLDDTMMCAGYEEGGRDSCQGDSGGPLVCYDEENWVLAGIVSWGEGCAYERRPGVYSRVSALIDWIERTISVNS